MKDKVKYFDRIVMEATHGDNLCKTEGCCNIRMGGWVNDSFDNYCSSCRDRIIDDDYLIIQLVSGFKLEVRTSVSQSHDLWRKFNDYKYDSLLIFIFDSLGKKYHIERINIAYMEWGGDETKRS